MLPESDYVVYADESGDHGLDSINPDYPVFVLAFCVFGRVAYCDMVSPALQRLKFKYFGHDMVVLHEREIRKAQGAFGFLTEPSRRAEFLGDISALVGGQDFTLIASVIDKIRHKKAYQAYAKNPYHLALYFCLERLYLFLNERGQGARLTRIVCESRGKKEDEELRKEFVDACKSNGTGKALPFELVFADKKVNSCGLQFADLIARPIGQKIIHPDRSNPPYDVISPKFRTYRGKIQGAGLKVFP